MSETLSLAVGGMTCASCVGRVERAIAAVPGVTRVAVSLATETATVRASGVDVEAVASAVRDAGYEASPKAAGTTPEAPRGLDLDTWIALVLTTPLVVGTMLPMASDAIHERIGFVMHFFMGGGGLVVAGIVQLVAGRRFYARAFAEVRHRSLGMSTLVALGSTAAYVYSAAAVVAPGLFPEGTLHTYFEASASIVTLVLLGKALEARARRRTAAALVGLAALRPKLAHVVRDGAELDLPLTDVNIGDLVRVRPGEIVPVDGEVVSGESLVDESKITGEPIPVVKRAADRLLSGAQNLRGALEIRADRVGDDTTLGQIIRLVENAQSEKSEAQAMADRIASVFVPIVLAVALATVLAWLALGPSPALSRALVAGVSVLVAACPCAMGLATPAALVVATGRAAELGVLLRKSTALDTLARADTLVLDKTGTVTRGAPEVLEARFFGDDEARTRRVVAAVEAKSEHPVGRAVLAYLAVDAASFPPVAGFAAELGAGVSATIEGASVVVGSAAYLRGHGVDLAPFAEGIAAMDREGRTPVLAALDGEARASFAVADAAKPEATAAIAALVALGLAPTLATGDVLPAAEAVARAVGIERVHAAQSPADKAALVERLRSEGKTVAFVGDGVNDAAALASADVGIAMGTGADIAVEAGDVVVMRGNLFALVDAVRLARATRARVRQNFFWAYAYNAALVPLAAGALYPSFGITFSPVLASVAMAASSLFVLGNSLRLKAFRASTPHRAGG